MLKLSVTTATVPASPTELPGSDLIALPAPVPVPDLFDLFVHSLGSL